MAVALPRPGNARSHTSLAPSVGMHLSYQYRTSGTPSTRPRSESPRRTATMWLGHSAGALARLRLRTLVKLLRNVCGVMALDAPSRSVEARARRPGGGS